MPKVRLRVPVGGPGHRQCRKLAKAHRRYSPQAAAMRSISVSSKNRHKLGNIPNYKGGSKMQMGLNSRTLCPPTPSYAHRSSPS